MKRTDGTEHLKYMFRRQHTQFNNSVWRPPNRRPPNRALETAVSNRDGYPSSLRDTG